MAEIRGRILEILPTENLTTKNGNLFQKRTLVLDATSYNPTTGEKFVNTPALEFSSTRCGILDNFKVGDLVKVSYNLKGRKVTNADGNYRYMTSVAAYAIEYVQQQNRQSKLQHGQQMPHQATYQAAPLRPNNGYNPMPQQNQQEDYTPF